MNETKKVATTDVRLKEILKEKGLRQADLVALAQAYEPSVNSSDISRYCAGTFVPARKKLFAISAALGVSESWLLGYDVDRNPNDTEQVYLELKDYEQRRMKANRKIIDYVGSNLSVLFWRASEEDRVKIRKILEKYADSTIYRDGKNTGYLKTFDVGLIDLPREIE